MQNPKMLKQLPYKTQNDYSELETQRNWQWLKHKPSFECNMGSARQHRLVQDFEKISEQCQQLSLILPRVFTDFFQAPNYWEKFLAVYGDFFYLDKSVIFCPYTQGYLLPFIADSQFCHYYYLHLYPNENAYQIVWTEDIYLMALLATPEQLATEFSEDELDETAIYLVDNDFEKFMFNWYYQFVEFFREKRQSLIEFSYAYSDLTQRKTNQDALYLKSKLLLNIDVPIPLTI